MDSINDLNNAAAAVVRAANNIVGEYNADIMARSPKVVLHRFSHELRKRSFEHKGDGECKEISDIMIAIQVLGELYPEIQ